MDIYEEFNKLKKENERLTKEKEFFLEKIRVAAMGISILLSLGYYENVELVLKDILKELGNGVIESGRSKRMKTAAEYFIIDENETPENMQEIILALRPKE